VKHLRNRTDTEALYQQKTNGVFSIDIAVGSRALVEHRR
jgi:hypothetical protein